MSSNPSLILIDSKLGPIYENIVKKRPTEPTYFQIEEMRGVIQKEYDILLGQRKALENKLAEESKSAKKTRVKFRSNLLLVKENLNKCLTNSDSLAKSSTQLSVNFAQITNRLDSATTIVNRANSLSKAIQHIKMYNENEKLEDVINALKESGYPVENISKMAEDVAKLCKITDTIAKQGCVSTAVANLHEHAKKLVEALTPLISNSTDPHELHDYMRALMMLSPDDRPLNKYIEGTVFFNSVQGADLQYSDEFLSEGINSIKSRYEDLCNFVSDQCATLFRDVDIIFDRPAQVKHTLLMQICSRLFSVFVDSVLQYISQSRTDEFCPMLMYFYETTSNTFKNIWAIENQQFASSPSTYLDAIFMKHQRLYGQFEISRLKADLYSYVNPSLEKLERVYKQTGISVLFKKQEEIVNPFDVFNDEIPHEVLSASKEALVRCYYLSPPEQLSNEFTELMSIFLEGSFNKYLTGVIKACSFSLVQSKKEENIGRFIKLITLINSNVLSLEDAYKNTLKAILQPLSIVHNNFIKLKEQLISVLESETTIGLQNCIDLASIRAKEILSNKQKRQDYTPGQTTVNVQATPSTGPVGFLSQFTASLTKKKSSSNLSSSSNDSSNMMEPAMMGSPETTDACRHFSSFVRKIVNEVNAQMYGDNKESFLMQLGKSLFKVIFEHLCQYRYNFYGSRVLMVDVAEYQTVLDLFEVESVSKRMMDLATTSLLMTTNAQNLTDVVRGQSLSRRAIKLSRKMLPLRTDAKEIDIDNIIPIMSENQGRINRL
ncbi:Exocyst complex component 5 [Tritrichomonas musculus]|uniref:Exocyst complex component 5 n=1 Tax=Tritrichomonas musculus TaxID=1915356 RepID=A0ABR2KSF3_9EUKA